MPSEASPIPVGNDACLYRGRAEVVLCGAARRTRNPALCLGRSKHPIGIKRVGRFPTPVIESLRESRVHHDLVHAALVLARSLLAFRPTTPDFDLAVSPINIRPLEPKCFLQAKRCSRVDQSERPLEPGVGAVQLRELFGAGLPRAWPPEGPARPRCHSRFAGSAALRDLRHLALTSAITRSRRPDQALTAIRNSSRRSSLINRRASQPCRVGMFFL